MRSVCAISRKIILFISLILLAGCQGIALPQAATPTPAGTPTPTPIPPFLVEIDTSVTRQTLREVGGGNYIHYFGGVETALDPVSTLNLKTLQPRVIRVRMDLDEWEPEPGTAPDGFQEVRHVKATFEFLREVKKQIPDVTLIASIWEVPDWMVSNPDDENNRIIPPEKYPVAIESIAQWLLRARDQYGTEVNYVSFNEANIGINILFTAEEQVALIRQAGPRFAELGLTTRWLLGDTANAASATSYIPPIYAAADIRPYLGPYSFHSWDSQVADQVLQSIGKYGDENGLEVWCTEGGWDPAEWQHPEQFPTWKHAMKMANIYTRVLRDTRATTLLYWDMMGNDYAVNDGTRPYPALVYFAELQKHFPQGAQIVKTPDDQIKTLTILSLAAKMPNGGFSVQVINQVKTERTVQLTGLPDGTYTLTRINETDGRQQLDPVQVNGSKAEIILPGQSITFLSLNQ